MSFSAFAWESGAGQAIDAKKVEFSEAKKLNIFKACWRRLDLDARTHRISVVIAAMLRFAPIMLPGNVKVEHSPKP